MIKISSLGRIYRILDQSCISKRRFKFEIIIHTFVAYVNEYQNVIGNKGSKYLARMECVYVQFSQERRGKFSRAK